MSLRVAIVGLVTVFAAACGSDSAESPGSTRPDQQAAGAYGRADDVLACVAGGATPEQVNELFERLAAPEVEGRMGRDLLEGIAAVSARPHGVAVEFDSSTSESRRAEIIAILDQPPVEQVRGSVEGCP